MLWYAVTFFVETLCKREPGWAASRIREELKP